MKKVRVALCGNPNSGKTTLFNALSGANHYVGNWAGVTVEKKSGSFKHGEHDVDLIDLPGIYSLSPYSLEEKVSRNFILSEDADVVINIVDASFLERNLYLTLQLIELGKPVVMALNMMDEARKNNIEIDTKALSKQLGIKVVPITAIKGEGLDSLMDNVIEAHENRAQYEMKIFDYGKTIEEEVDKVKVTYGHNFADHVNQRWTALKIAENDPDIMASSGVEETLYPEGETAIAERRYDIVTGIVDVTTKFNRDNVHDLTDKVDKILLNKYLGLPIFALIMSTMFYLTFTIGGIFLDAIDVFFSDTLSTWVSIGLESLQVADWMQSLIVDGIIGGVGGVLTFVPNIAILFLLISLLEDSGYMARAAILMDRWMNRVGLNGKTFIPMILGFGCNVPAIMGTRTLENEKDRMIAILINPFMSCGARMPVYVLFASLFFPGNETIVTISLYFLGILVALTMAFIFRKTLFKGDEIPFIMEIPPYRLPSLKSLFIHVWERVKGYLVKAGTVIFAASVVIWVVLNFNTTGMVDITESFGASLGALIAPIFAPLGFGNWQSALSLISGLVAKEIVVANMAILFGATDGGMVSMATAMAPYFTQLSAYAFMVFVLLYTPCVAVVGVIKRETNSWKWTMFSVTYQFAVAWIVALLVYQGGSLLLNLMG